MSALLSKLRWLSVWFIQPVTVCCAIQDIFVLLTTLHTLIQNIPLNTPSHPLTHAPAHAHSVYGPEISDIQVLPLLLPLVNCWTFRDDNSEAISKSVSQQQVRHSGEQPWIVWVTLELPGKKKTTTTYYCRDAPFCRLSLLTERLFPSYSESSQIVGLFSLFCFSFNAVPSDRSVFTLA